MDFSIVKTDVAVEKSSIFIQVILSQGDVDNMVMISWMQLDISQMLFIFFNLWSILSTDASTAEILP